MELDNNTLKTVAPKNLGTKVQNVRVFDAQKVKCDLGQKTP